MKKRLMDFLLATMLIFLCVGCGAESTATEQADTSTTALEEECTTEPVETVEKETLSLEESSEQVSGITTDSSEDTKNETELAETSLEEATESAKIADLEQTETPSAESVPQYTFTDMSLIMYAQQTVNIRELPDTNGNKLGSLSTNDEVTITGQCNETSWYRIDYNGSVAYVSNKYVSENKVDVQQSTDNNPSSGSKSKDISRNATDYRSVSSLSELTYVGDGWDSDYAGFCANYRNIEKVTYTHNGITVLLYDYRMIRTYDTPPDAPPHTYENVLFYDFSYPSKPWCQVSISAVDSYIDEGGFTSSWGFNPISNYQVY